MQNLKSTYKILSSGHEFFNNLIKEIGRARKHIVIKAFLWRNDEAGQIVANSLLRAADRGIKVVIIKDRIGAFYEYGEGNGQSFFHDNPYPDRYFQIHSQYSVYVQARAMSWFYGNGRMKPQKNPHLSIFRSHKNIQVLDQYKLYDHSKVIVIDEKISYMGGIGFGNEFYLENENKWTDYMLKIDGKESAELLLQFSNQPLLLNQQKDLYFITDNYLKAKGSSIHDQTLDFMEKTKNKLMIEMPFLGNPDYINKITDLIKRKVEVVLIIPRKSTSHRWRNHHFIKRLKRQVNNSPRLEVVTVNGMLHGKVMIRDEEVIFFGSQNCHMDKSVFNETNVITKKASIVKELSKKIIEDYNNSVPYQSFSWFRILPPSRAEYFMVKYQTFIKRVRYNRIETVRAATDKMVTEIL